MDKLVEETEELRKLLDITKEEIANKANIRRKTYEKWINGETNPVGKHSKNLENTKEELEEEMKKADITEEMHNKCVWEYQKYFGHYITDCGEDFSTIAAPIAGFNYCPFCGKEIKVNK